MAGPVADQRHSGPDGTEQDGTEYDCGVSETGAATWLVVPTYDEAANIERFVAAVRETLPEPRRILIVDDNSPDGTGRLADELAAAHEDVEVLHRTVKQGLGPAYVAGFQRALAGGAARVISMDADFSHDPADLPRMVEASIGAIGAGSGSTARSKDYDDAPDGIGADLVIGSRYVEGGAIADWGPLRRFVSRGGSTYSRITLGLPVRDLTGGFKCYRREVLEAIDLPSLQSLGYAFQVETTFRAWRAGFRVVEVPILFTERREGDSKMSKAIFAEAVWRVPLMRIRGRSLGYAKRERSTRSTR